MTEKGELLCRLIAEDEIANAGMNCPMGTLFEKDPKPTRHTRSFFRQYRAVCAAILIEKCHTKLPRQKRKHCRCSRSYGTRKCDGYVSEMSKQRSRQRKILWLFGLQRRLANLRFLKDGAKKHSQRKNVPQIY